MTLVSRLLFRVHSHALRPGLDGFVGLPAYREPARRKPGYDERATQRNAALLFMGALPWCWDGVAAEGLMAM